jgi:hypothetical protein
MEQYGQCVGSDGGEGASIPSVSGFECMSSRSGKLASVGAADPRALASALLFAMARTHRTSQLLFFGSVFIHERAEFRAEARVPKPIFDRQRYEQSPSIRMVVARQR